MTIDVLAMLLLTLLLDGFAVKNNEKPNSVNHLYSRMLECMLVEIKPNIILCQLSCLAVKPRRGHPSRVPEEGER